MKVERFKKKRLYRIFLKVIIILNFLFIVNCKKISQNEIHVKGVFWDYCREKPLANFPIRIAVYKGNSGYKIIAETTSDKNGNFDFGKLKLVKVSSYHIYAYYNQEIDQLNKVADAFAKNTEGIFINKQNRNTVFKNNLLNDTIRICTFNRSYGRYCFASSVNADYYDAITVTISSKYYKGEKDVNLDFRDNAECVETNFGAQHCGKYFVKFKKVKNGFVTYQEDSIDLKWKADPAFEYEITL